MYCMYRSYSYTRIIMFSIWKVIDARAACEIPRRSHEWESAAEDGSYGSEHGSCGCECHVGDSRLRRRTRWTCCPSTRTLTDAVIVDTDTVPTQSLCLPYALVLVSGTSPPHGTWSFLQFLTLLLRRYRGMAPKHRDGDVVATVSLSAP